MTTSTAPQATASSTEISTPRSSASIALDLEAIDAEIRRRTTPEDRRRHESVEQLKAQLDRLLLARENGESVSSEIATVRQAMDDGKLQVEANDLKRRELVRQREKIDAELVDAREREHHALREDLDARVPALRRQKLDALLTILRLSDREAGLWTATNQSAYELEAFYRTRGITKHVSIVRFVGTGPTLADHAASAAHYLAKELGLELNTSTWTIVGERQDAPKDAD